MSNESIGEEEEEEQPQDQSPECGFMFDFIVVRIDVPGLQIEDNRQLSVEANFNNNTLKITPSRINVVEIKPQRSFEFSMSPAKLKTELSENPFTLKVSYCREVIGNATIPWCPDFLEKIDKCMGDLFHIDECELTNCECEERAGVLEYIIRLQCKCEEFVDGEVCAAPNEEDIKQLRKEINPYDVLFLVSSPPDTSCRVEEEPEADCTTIKSTKLIDLDPYRFLNGMTVDTCDVVNTCYNEDCCDLACVCPQKEIDAIIRASENGKFSDSDSVCSCCCGRLEGGGKARPSMHGHGVSKKLRKSKNRRKAATSASQTRSNSANCYNLDNILQEFAPMKTEEKVKMYDFQAPKSSYICYLNADEILEEYFSDNESKVRRNKRKKFYKKFP